MEMSIYVGFYNNMIAVTWVKIHWFNAISCCVKIWKCTQEYMSNNNPLYTCVYRTSFILKLPLLTVVLVTLVNNDQMTLSIAPTHIIVRDMFYPFSRHILSSLSLNSRKGEVLTLHILSSTTTHTKVCNVCYHVTFSILS